MSTENTRALSSEDCRKGLKTLGFHPLLQRHTYLELSLSSLQLNEVDLLRDYPNVMYLDISDNQIRSLRPLGSIAALVQLRARKNKLTDCLQFSPKHCRDGHSWPEGQRAVGSMLTLADLSDNEIERIGDLSPHRFLECVLLANNSIRWIEGLRNLRFLQTLDLSGNQIARIEGLDTLPLRELRLAHNQLTSLEGLDKLPCLSALDVSYNRIKTLAPIQALPHLNALDVRGNDLQFLRQAEFLTACPWLHIFCIRDNPCALKPHYRLRVLFRLPHLQRLDGVTVSPEEKIRAFNMYRAASGDLDQRAGVLAVHCPDLQFVDFAAQQLPYDEEEDITSEELALGELLPFEAPTSSVREVPGGKVLEASQDDLGPSQMLAQSSFAEPSHYQNEDSLGAGEMIMAEGFDAPETTEDRKGAGFYGGALDQEEVDGSRVSVPIQ